MEFGQALLSKSSIPLMHMILAQSFGADIAFSGTAFQFFAGLHWCICGLYLLLGACQLTGGIFNKVLTLSFMALLSAIAPLVAARKGQKQVIAVTVGGLCS